MTEASPKVGTTQAIGLARGSYSQILKSSSIIGGAQAINYLIAMVRTKFVAVLLGPAGIGLVGLYQSIMEFAALVTSLGIQSSGVREIAEAQTSGNSETVAQTAKVLRRVCWVTGIFGWALTAVCSWPLSRLIFETDAQAPALTLLGITLLLGAISGGQKALLQGLRRISDLARLSIITSVVNTALAIGIYSWMGLRGIVPVLITSAAVSLTISWWYCRRVKVGNALLSWRETWTNSRRLVGVGIAFMYGAILTMGVALATRALVLRELGLEANGIYQSAWAISGMFAGFILSAMGSDFYPRLTAAANNSTEMNRLVNEQTEIGILLALPGLIGTLAFAPALMKVFYTSRFLPGAELLPWFVLGIFGRVVSWPIGFIQMAKGATGWLFVTHTHSYTLLMVLTVVFLKTFGLVGTAIAFAVLYPVHTALSFYIARRLTQFHWSTGVLKLLAVSGPFVAIGFILQKTLSQTQSLATGALLTVVACWFSARGIIRRLGRNHRLVKLALRIPGMRLATSL